MASRKETILTAICTRIGQIITGNWADPGHTYKFVNTVSYVDRQYLQFETEDVKTHPMPWVIVNNDGEMFKPLPSRRFENEILVSIVGFVVVDDTTPDLDTSMNSLQKDIMIALLTDPSIADTCAYIMPTEIQTVDEMIWPFGGFVIGLKIVYTFTGIDI